MTPSWRDDAACLGTDTELFYADSPEQIYRQLIRTFCNRCQVRDECLADAFSFEQQDGVAGGLTAHARIVLRRKARRAAARRAA